MGHWRALQQGLGAVSEMLTIIFQREDKVGKVPEAWRKASNILVFKKVIMVGLRNYRLLQFKTLGNFGTNCWELLASDLEVSKVIKAANVDLAKADHTSRFFF